MSDAASPSTRAVRARKFDRPAPPHDWRWWVGGVGKTLIGTGLLLFGFVAYQLWGTGIETARAQDSLGSEFEELLATAPAPTPAPGDSTPADLTPADSTPGDSAPVGPTAENTSPAPDVIIAPIIEGDAIARIELPRIGVDKIVVAGVDKNDLKKGPGHYPETPMPGQLGNAAIAGHRTTFGQPFFDIDKMETGDEIVVTTVAGRFVYRVTGQEIVSPSDYQVIATTDPTRATLTLTSCHPKYTARERIIVYAELDATASGPVSEATINYGRPLDEMATAAADPDPSNTVVDPATDPATDPAVDPATGDDNETESSVPVEDPTLAASLDDEQLDAGIADAFSDSWFSDPGANSQVGLWGLLLAAIGIVSYLISRTFKRDWIGLLVGVGPFMVSLYFFFQNVNRLLPPNL